MGLLVEPEELSEALREGKALAVDVRSFAEYARAHIPGSIWFYVWDLTEHEKGHPSRPKPPDELAAVLGRNGISDKDRVVIVYDARSLELATYLYWYLEYLGHEEKYILRGGIEAWLSKGLPVERGVAKVRGKSYRYKLRHEVRCSLEDVLRALRGDYPATIIDVRSKDEHTGSVRLTPRAGRIPGSKLIEPEVFASVLNGDAKARDKILGLVGGAGSGEVIVYCATGERASLAWLVFTKILGVKARLYPESFLEYSSREDLSVETG